MADKPVSIRVGFSPNPAEQQNYTVICHSYRIHTVVTANPSVVRTWVHRTRQHNRIRLRLGSLVVGLGVQWVPRCRSPAATLQLCVDHHCLIFQLLHAVHFPTEPRSFLSDPNIIFVGLWNNRDADLLENSRHRLHVSRLVDVGDVARDVKGCARKASMEALAEEVLGMDGFDRKKAVGRSAWDARWLSKQQVEYACIDVLFSLLMAKALRVWEWLER